MAALRSRPRPLTVERLEDRQVLAGNVLAMVSGQTLLIWGDEAANGVVLTYNSQTQTYRVIGQDAGGAPTTINGLDTSLPANAVELAGVKHVAVGMNGGDDSFAVGSPQAVDTVISKWLAIDMGAGNDAVVLGRAGNAAAGADPVALSLRAGTVVVQLGAGDDTLSVANAELGHHFAVGAGEGNDQVHFATEFVATGATMATLFPVVIRGHSSVDLGGGNDTLDMRHVALGGHLRINDAAGTADLDLLDVSIGKKLDIDTGHEADTIKLDFVRSKDFTLDSNGGVEDIDVTNSRFRSLIFKLGDGRDHLLFRHVTVSWVTRLDGGAAGSTYAQGPGNKLRSLTRKNLG